MESGRRKMLAVACVVACVVAGGCSRWTRVTSVDAAEGGAVGIFEGTGDVGQVLHKGSVEFDAAKGTYTIAGSGENMWFASDDFQFVWKKGKGDVTLTAELARAGELLDVDVLDHLIIGRGRHVSLRRLGLGFPSGR